MTIPDDALILVPGLPPRPPEPSLARALGWTVRAMGISCSVYAPALAGAVWARLRGRR